MATKFELKLAITRLICEISPRFLRLAGGFRGPAIERCDSDEDGTPDPTEVVNKDEFLTNLALFFARLSTKHLIPDSTIDTIADELQNMSSLHLSYVTGNLRSSLSAAGASDDLMSCVLSSVESSDLVKESLCQLL